MPAVSPRPSNEDRIRAASWFAEHGFGVFPVWSTREDGQCRCPAGAGCDSPGKHPITGDGFKSATTDPQRIRTFLGAASQPNYGMTCPEGVFALDVDGEDIEKLADLERQHGLLPATLRTRTANGWHIFLRWPDAHPRPLKQLFGMVTRWGSGKAAGYVIGPRSVHPSGVAYTPAEDAVPEIATLPDAWAVAGVTPARTGTITVSSGSPLESVSEGHRHEFLRDRARTLRGGGLTGDALFSALQELNERYCVPPKSAEALRRAIGDVETKFDADPVPGTPEAEERAEARHGGLTGMLIAEDPEVAFPEPPHAIAYGGLLGECADFLLEGTDASPVGILASLVAFSGALMPAWGYWHGRHPSSPFLALVGQSGDGRKGTAMYRVRDALGNSLGMDTVNRVRFDGVASGEALVKALLERTQETFGTATGVLFEEEYATFLAAAGREGSNLDSRMRSAFDGKQLSLRKVGDKLIVPEPYYLSGLVAITPSELQRIFQRGSFTSGSGNRWLWLPVVRREVRVISTEPIFPFELTEALLEAHKASLKTPARIDPTPEADHLLSDYDDYLRANATGTAARMTRRFGVLALRMGLVHAAVERSPVITRGHIIRAIALTDYALRGLTYTFGHAAGDADATHLLRMLRDSDTGELTQSDLKRDFIREPIRRQAAIDELQTLGLADVTKVRTSGRPATLLRLRAPKQDFGDFGALLATEPNAENGNSVPKVDSRSGKGVPKVPEGVQKGAPSRSIEPAEVLVDHSTGEVMDATADWLRPCAAYDEHRTQHRATPEGWVCLRCHPELSEETPTDGQKEEA